MSIATFNPFANITSRPAPSRVSSEQHTQRQRSPAPRRCSSATSSFRSYSNPPLERQIRPLADKSNFLPGFWNWDPDKSEMVFCKKSRNGEHGEEVLTSKSPAKAEITTKPLPLSTALQFQDHDIASGALFPVSSTSPSLGLPRRAHSNPEPARDSLSFDYDITSFDTESKEPSSPPLLRFNAEFSGWLLPNGVDTSLPDEDYPELPDLSNSFANTSNISSDSDVAPPTPHRNVGLGLGLGLVQPTKPMVFCHDGTLSETFLQEAVLTFNAMGEEAGVDHAATPTSDKRDHTSQSNATPRTTADSTEAHIAKSSSPQTTARVKSTDSTKFGRARSLQRPEPTRMKRTSADSPASVPLVKSSASNTAPKSEANPPRRLTSILTTPKAVSSNTVRRSMSLQQRGNGRDVTTSTVSSSLKLNKVSSSDPTITTTTTTSTMTAVENNRLSGISGRGRSVARNNGHSTSTLTPGPGRSRAGSNEVQERAQRAQSQSQNRGRRADDSSPLSFVSSARLSLERETRTRKNRMSWR